MQNKMTVYKDTNKDLYNKHKELYTSLGYKIESENEQTCILSKTVGGQERKVSISLVMGDKIMATAK